MARWWTGWMAVAALAACAEGPAPEETVRAAADPGSRASGKADGAGSPWFYLSASTVEALDSALDTVRPPVEVLFPNDPLAPEDYLRPMSCLGYYGPLGPWGPLGILGPIGDGVWSPDFYISGDGALAWHGWAEDLAEAGGPLSADGPLGDAYWDEALVTNDFDRQLRAGGVWSVLGPAGPLGALGPLGPLGPVGAHGYRRDDEGRYVDEERGEVVRTVEIPWDDAGATRRYELFELYDEDFARGMPDNDTSFLVRGVIAPDDEADAYPFRSADEQFVTLLVVPESASMYAPQAMSVLYAAAALGYRTPPVAPAPRYTTDDFDLRLETADGTLLALSDTAAYAEWIQARVPADTALRAVVTMASSWDPWNLSPISRRYRLVVVGSTKHIATTPITGAHQLPLPLEP